ncbi:hypothetical protein BKA70DRAFT_1232078 [Coprinopsis sp. MPI-PUGE-AT-0042]|nr:hypothetical protein BKA70DRAFT_1232078 [Coprinopsis sp. MPI-PUGE-AT-0042]
MSDQLQCIPECGLLFSNSGGLTHDQSVCKVFKGRQREVRAAAQRVREAARAQETRAGPSSTTSWAINLDIDEPVSSYSQVFSSFITFYASYQWGPWFFKVHDTAQARLGLGASELHQEQDKKCAAASGPAAESGRRFRSRSIAMLPHLEPTGYVPGFATPNPQQHCDDAAETGYRNSGSSLQTIPVREEDLSHAHRCLTNNAAQPKIPLGSTNSIHTQTATISIRMDS